MKFYVSNGVADQPKKIGVADQPKKVFFSTFSSIWIGCLEKSRNLIGCLETLFNLRNRVLSKELMTECSSILTDGSNKNMFRWKVRRRKLFAFNNKKLLMILQSQ